MSQPTLDAHAGTFANVKLDGRDAPSTLFCFVTNSPQGPKLSVIEVGGPKDNVFKIMADVRFQSEQVRLRLANVMPRIVSQSTLRRTLPCQ